MYTQPVHIPACEPDDSTILRFSSSAVKPRVELTLPDGVPDAATESGNDEVQREDVERDVYRFGGLWTLKLLRNECAF